MNNSTEIEILIQEAKSHFKNNEIEKSEEICDSILSKVNNIEILFLKSAILAQKHNYLLSLSLLSEILKIEPNNKIALLNSAILNFQLGRIDNSLEYFSKLELNFPNDEQVQYNFAFALQEVGQTEEAIYHYEKTLKNNPKNSDAINNLSLLYLLKKKYKLGFELFESRFSSSELKRKEIPRNRWNGDNVKDKILYVYQDQGLGDTIQFARFLKIARNRVKKLILEVQQPLIEIFQYSNLADEIVETKADFSYSADFDLQIPMMSFPFALKLYDENQFKSEPYLQFQKKEFALLKNVNKPKVGIVWKGGNAFRKNHLRSTKIENWTNIFKHNEYAFFSFQKEVDENEMKILAQNNVVDLCEHLTNFSETANLIDKMDLIITTDTSIPHISGAIGKKTWLLLHKTADWRWGIEEKTSIWYPKTTIFRQNVLGNWSTVFEEINELLNSKW